MIYDENLTEEEKKLIYEKIPQILEKYPEVKLILWKKLMESFAEEKETESKFEILLKKLHEGEKRVRTKIEGTQGGVRAQKT